jgi:hypothetical protein
VKHTTFRFLVVLCALAPLGASTGIARELTFEERVQAQEAIERVYYSHQIGATRPFEEAVPREVLERKVRTYLKQTAALEQFWHTPITAEMLQAEIGRIIHSTRMPDRLREVFQAVGNDPFVIQECLARPTLVGHLTRNFFKSDTRIHGAVRAEAEALRVRILRGELSVYKAEEHRFIIHPGHDTMDVTEDSVARDPAVTDRRRLGISGAVRLNDSSNDVLGSAHTIPSEIGELVEEDEGFFFQVPLGEQEGEATTAVYSFPKIPWDSWWALHQAEFADSSVTPSATESSLVQSLAESVGNATLNCNPGDTWANGSLEGGPQPRSGHAKVWTGSLMLIWGGLVGNSESTNTGAKYDPLTDTWTQTSRIGAP